MKLTILLFIFTLTINADYLKISNNHCITSITPDQNNTGFCYFDIDLNTSYCDSNLKLTDLIDGYFYEDGYCLYNNDLLLTGLSQNQWNYYMAFMANLLGFTMFFLISYLSIMIAKK